MTLQTIEVEVDAHGHLRAIGPEVCVPAGRALLTMLEPPAPAPALLSEAALSEDWLRPEEDEAWAHLQPVK